MERQPDRRRTGPPPFERRARTSEIGCRRGRFRSDAQARRLAERIEWLDTKKHGRWLDMAQCLNRRIPDNKTRIEGAAAWEGGRNNHHAKADWQFTTRMPALN